MTDPNDKAIMDSLEDKDTGSKNGKKETLNVLGLTGSDDDSDRNNNKNIKKSANKKRTTKPKQKDSAVDNEVEDDEDSSYDDIEHTEDEAESTSTLTKALEEKERLFNIASDAYEKEKSDANSEAMFTAGKSVRVAKIKISVAQSRNPLTKKMDEDLTQGKILSKH